MHECNARRPRIFLPHHYASSHHASKTNQHRNVLCLHCTRPHELRVFAVSACALHSKIHAYEGSSLMVCVNAMQGGPGSFSPHHYASSHHASKKNQHRNVLCLHCMRPHELRVFAVFACALHSKIHAYEGSSLMEAGLAFMFCMFVVFFCA